LVGHHQDLRMAGQQELALDMDLQRPEAAAERDLPLGREARLVAEYQQVRAVQRRFDLAEQGVIDRFRQIDVTDFGPDNGRKRRNAGIHGQVPGSLRWIAAIQSGYSATTDGARGNFGRDGPQAFLKAVRWRMATSRSGRPRR